MFLTSTYLRRLCGDPVVGGAEGRRVGGAARVWRAAADEDVQAGCDLEPGESPLYFSISGLKVGGKLWRETGKI